MKNFEEINFDTFLDHYEFADENGTLLRISNYSEWLNFSFKNNIDIDKVNETAASLTGCKKIFI